MKLKKRGRAPQQEINASSMADIAFLLLIFFLVTTEITEDQGVLVRLPPWSDLPPEKTNVNPRNIFDVLVNKNNELLVRGEIADLETLRERTKTFILNPSAAPDMAVLPKSAIVSLKNDRGTNYATYVTVYNELLGAYNEIWEEEAQSSLGKNYEQLTDSQKEVIRKEFPLVLSEAEPSAFGDEN